MQSLIFHTDIKRHTAVGINKSGINKSVHEETGFIYIYYTGLTLSVPKEKDINNGA